MPDLPQAPAPYSQPLATYVLSAVMVASVIAFTWVVCAYIIRPVGRPRWGLIAITLAVMVISLAVISLLDSVGRSKANEARAAHWQMERAAMAQVVAELERVYGVEFPEHALVPLLDDDYHRETLLLADGSTQECYTAARGGRYVITCGGSGPENGTPLAPVGADDE